MLKNAPSCCLCVCLITDYPQVYMSGSETVSEKCQMALKITSHHQIFCKLINTEIKTQRFGCKRRSLAVCEMPAVRRSVMGWRDTAEHAEHGVWRASEAWRSTAQHIAEESDAAYYSAVKQSTLQFSPSSNSTAQQSQLIRVSGLRAASSGWRAVKGVCSVLLGGYDLKATFRPL